MKKQSILILLFPFLIVIYSYVNNNLLAQQSITPTEYTVLGLSVEGNSIVEAETILGLVSIYQGDKITYPADDKIQSAISNLWKRNQFKDVRIIAERVTVDGVFLKIFVEEFPRLYKINISG